MSGPENPITPGPRLTEMLQRFGDYHLVAKLARGGMAEIFLAKRFGVGGFERNVVIKRMLDDLTTEQEFVTMFLDEARLAAKLTHPNIAQITDFGVIDNRYYICMEHIAGEDLRAISSKCREKNINVPIDVGLRIILAVCEGLEYAHELTEEGRSLNIVHRDVSPSNIMVSFQGSVKLLDFGIAKATSRVGETTTGKLKGKITFMSPEQVQGGTIDGRSDIFALGLTAYELLTQKRVFHRDSDMASLNAVLHAPIPKPTEFRPDMPAEVEAILMRALERDLSKRYASAGAMRAEIQAYLSRVDTEPGSRKLADFMLTFFGREHMQRRTSIPSLAEQNPTPYARDALRATVPANLAEDETAHSAPVAALSSDTIRGHGKSRGREALIVAGLAIAIVGVAAVWRLGSSRSVTAPAVTAPVAAVPIAPAPVPATAPTSAPVAAVAPPPTAPRQKAAATVAVALTDKIVESVMGKAHGRVLACFEKNRDALSAKEGQVTLSLTVVQSGKVTDADVSTPGISSSALSGCIAREAKLLKFPRLTDGQQFRVPFNYRIP